MYFIPTIRDNSTFFQENSISIELTFYNLFQLVSLPFTQYASCSMGYIMIMENFGFEKR